MPIGDWNEFRTFVYRTGLGIKKGEQKGKKPTHLLLDGGSLAVPPEREQEFLDKYAFELSTGTDLFVVEMKSTPCFFLMSEFDIKFPREHPMTHEDLLEFVRVVQSVVVRAFPEVNTQVAVSTAPLMETFTNGSEETKRPCVKCGVHMNWRVPVDLDTAWVVREWILRELDSQLSPNDNFPLMEPWTEAYDPCVFYDNGLRMIGSRKAEICSVCKGQCYRRGKKTTPSGPVLGQPVGADELGSVCDNCHSVGRIDKGRPYSLIMVLGEDGNPVPEALEYFTQLANLKDLVKFTSIRCPSGEEEFEKPANMVFPDEETRRRIVEAAKASRREGRKKKTTKVPKEPVADKDATEERAKKRDELVDVMPDDKVYAPLSQYIMGEFRGAPIVSHVKKTASGDCYIVNTRCHFCENKGEDHKHSFVYYIVKSGGCAQRCFCEKDYNGKLCKNFVGKFRKVPTDLLEMMFSSVLLASKRKEEKRMRVATRLMAVIDDESGPVAASAAAAVAPGHYGEAPGITLPPLTGRAATIGLRRISPKRDYNSVRASIVPLYTVSRFMNDLKGAKFIIPKN